MFPALAAVFLPGCGGNSSTATASYAATIKNVQPLVNGFTYQGWAIINGAPKSFGKFNVDSSGGLVTPTGSPLSAFSLGSEFAGATKLVVTIEPNGNPNDVPSSTHFIAGPIVAGKATLVTNDSAALGTDFATAAGSFILATPTAPQPPANPTSGVWFLNLPGPTAALTLPTLPAGWTYEGWAVINGQPVSTGKFTSASGADASAAFSGTNPGPPFPGEDFLKNAPAGLTFPTDLVGKPIVVTVEPVPDDGAGPFSLKPLLGTAPAGTLPMTSVALANNAAASAPQMTVTVNQ